MLDFFIVGLIGIIGGVTHIFIFKDGKFYKPKTFSDKDGRSFRDYGFWKEIFIGIIAAFITTIPTWTFVPLPHKILPALLASITGSSFITNAINNFLEKQKERREKELVNIVSKRKGKKGKETENDDSGGE